MKRDTCDSCKAFSPATRECRRHAPVMVPVQQQNLAGQQAMAAAGMWPATKPDNWCEEYIADQGGALALN